MEQKNYCFEFILGSLRRQVTIPGDNLIPQISSFTIHNIMVLPVIYRNIEDDTEFQNVIIAMLFLLLKQIHITGYNEDQYILNAIEIIGKDKPEIISIFFQGFLEFYNFHKKYWHYRYRNIDETAIKKDFDELLENIMKGKSTITLAEIPLDDISLILLHRAIKVVPLLKDLNKANQIFKSILKISLTCKKKPRNMYYLQSSWKDSYVSFLYRIPIDAAKIYFDKILDMIINNYDNIYRLSHDFVKEFISVFLYEVDKNNELTITFWKFWKALYKKAIREIKNTIFMELTPALFLYKGYRWNKSLYNWKPLKAKKDFMQKVYKNFAFNFLKEAVILLAGIGFEELIPEGITWLYKIMKNERPEIMKQLENSDTIYHFEKLFCRIYYLKRNILHKNRIFKEELLKILDILIETGSSISYIIRDRALSIQVYDIPDKAE